MKTCVYTCITGNYDNLSGIFPNQSANVDFICYTDNQALKYRSGNWDIRLIPPELRRLQPVKQQRIVKACPHRYLLEYDVSMWIDGNISIISDVMEFISRYNLDRIHIFTRRHPFRNCIYEEEKKVLQLKKDFPSITNRQIERYRRDGFPKSFGLHETGIMLRRHNETDAKTFGNMWAKEIMDGSHRDQLSFDYCRWKLGISIGQLATDKLTEDRTFRWREHG